MADEKTMTNGKMMADEKTMANGKMMADEKTMTNGEMMDAIKKYDKVAYEQLKVSLKLAEKQYMDIRNALIKMKYVKFVKTKNDEEQKRAEEEIRRAEEYNKRMQNEKKNKVINQQQLMDMLMKMVKGNNEISKPED